MTENNLHKKDFSEADSPIPLIAADQAWDNMRVQLDEQLPVEKKKKRRFLFWLPPIGCASAFLLLALLTGLAWWFSQTTENKRSAPPSLSYKKTAIPYVPAPPANRENTIAASDKKDSISSMYGSRSIKRTITKTRLQTPRTKHLYDNNLSYSFPRTTPISYVILMPLQPKRSFAPIPFPDPLKDSVPQQPPVWSAGLQWQLPVPVHGTRFYFTGPDGKHQVHRLLIPAAWLSFTKNKHRLTVEIAPFYTSQLPSKLYETTLVQITDSITVFAQKKLVKNFGSRIGLHYSYQPGLHWQLQGSLYGTRWHTGLIDAVPVDSSGYGRFNYSVKTSQENALKLFQPAAAIGIGYIHHSMEGWLQVEQAVTSPVKGLKPPVSVSLSLRWNMLKTFVNKKRN